MPESFWQNLFLSDHPALSAIWGPLIGTIVAILAFVCSIGNVPLAAVLWNGGISFGGVVAFIYADLLVIPILNIYRKYYGMKMTAVLFSTFYVAMAGAGYIVEILFSATNLVPEHREAMVMQDDMSWNYTTWLNRETDPVCGMLLHPADVATRITWHGIDFAFCSEMCKQAFEEEPAHFAAVQRR